MANWIRLGTGAILLSSAVATGTATAAPTVQITPHLDVLYDSNMARSSDAIAEARDLHQSDIRYTPAVDILAENPLGRQTLFLSGSVGYDIHQRNSRLDRERIFGTGGLRYQFSRCSGTAAGSYSRQQSEVSDFIDIGPVKNTQTTTTVGVDARCGGPVGFIPTFGVSRSWTHNSNKLRDFGDWVSTTFRGGVAYARPSFGELELLGEYTDVNYPDRDSLGPDVSNGYHLYSFGGRFTRNIGSRLRGSVGLFHTTVDQQDDRDKFTGLTADAAIDFTLSDATKIHVFAERKVLPANLFVGDYVLAKNYSLRVEHAMGPRLVLSGGASLIDRDIRGEIPLTIVTLESEKRYLGFVRATYSVRENASVAVELAREVRHADPDAFDYSSTRALLSLRYAFGRTS